MKHIIVTDLDLGTLIKKIESITLSYEKINTTQFKDSYHYKGKVTTEKFVIENIFVGYNNPSNIIKGEFKLENNKTIIYIEIENAGTNLIKVLFLALLLPFLVVMSLVSAFINNDFNLLFYLIIFLFVFFIVKKQINSNAGEEDIINDFKKKINI